MNNLLVLFEGYCQLLGPRSSLVPAIFSLILFFLRWVFLHVSQLTMLIQQLNCCWFMNDSSGLQCFSFYHLNLKQAVLCILMCFSIKRLCSLETWLFVSSSLTYAKWWKQSLYEGLCKRKRWWKESKYWEWKGEVNQRGTEHEWGRKKMSMAVSFRIPHGFHGLKMKVDERAWGWAKCSPER